MIVDTSDADWKGMAKERLCNVCSGEGYLEDCDTCGGKRVEECKECDEKGKVEDDYEPLDDDEESDDGEDGDNTDEENDEDEKDE